MILHFSSFIYFLQTKSNFATINDYFKYPLSVCLSEVLGLMDGKLIFSPVFCTATLIKNLNATNCNIIYFTFIFFAFFFCIFMCRNYKSKSTASI